MKISRDGKLAVAPDGTRLVSVEAACVCDGCYLLDVATGLCASEAITSRWTRCRGIVWVPADGTRKAASPKRGQFEGRCYRDRGGVLHEQTRYTSCAHCSLVTRGICSIDIVACMTRAPGSMWRRCER